MAYGLYLFIRGFKIWIFKLMFNLISLFIISTIYFKWVRVAKLELIFTISYGDDCVDNLEGGA